MRPYGQAVKTSPFHGGIPGSNPGRVTNFIIYYGRLAQLGEHLPYKQGVIGSSPIPPTIVDSNLTKRLNNDIIKKM